MKYTDIDLNGKTVLITGGAGFIGSNLALHIQENYPNCEIVVFDAFVLGHFKNLIGFKGRVVAGDIANRDDLRELSDYKFDYVFHQAAISDTTVMDQAEVIKVNTNAFKRILDIAANHQAGVVYASSAATYGNSPAPNRIGQGEVPENVYGFSKLQMDLLAPAFIAQHDIPVVGLRYFNVYGPREEFKGRTASMMLQLSKQLCAGDRPKLFKYGEQRRDFVCIEDIIQANMKALSPNHCGTFNVGSGIARTFNDVYQNVQKAVNIFKEAEFVDNPWPFYQMHTEADISTALEGIAYVPNYTLETGIEFYGSELRRLNGLEESHEAAA